MAPQQRTLRAQELASNSPEDEPGPSCSSADPDFLELTIPHLVSQSELNDPARDLSLSKIQAELLASCLQGWNLLQQGIQVSHKKR